MSVSYFPPEGDVLKAEDLTNPKAQELVSTISTGSIPYVSYLECRRSHAQDGSQPTETIVFEVEVERSQRVVQDIRSVERLSVSFRSDDKTYPEVLALRTDFPRVPHLNLRDKEFPRSLCPYQESYQEVKLDWNSVRFVERVREWLSLTAKGILHGEDQPLEPLFFETLDNLLIPHHLASNIEEVPDLLEITRLKSWTKHIVLKLNQMEPQRKQNEPPLFGLAIVFRCAPQTHGVIYRRPSDFSQLCDVTSNPNLDLSTELKRRLSRLLKEDRLKGFAAKRLALVIFFPKKRTASGGVEVSDVWGFLFDDDIGTIGKEIGISEVREGYIVPLLQQDDSKRGGHLGLTLLSPMYLFSREIAARQNGMPMRADLKITAIGLGALGSQLFMNLIRAGFGQWILIDDDILLPHNLARHALTGDAVSWPKAFALAHVANGTIEGDPIAHCLMENVLNPTYHAEEIQKVLKEADAILDVSVSVAVARHLARDVDSQSRRISVFLAPSGRDLVMLAESRNRAIKLDSLEMQYYRLVIGNATLKDHLRPNDRVVRYANSCRDISSTISQDLISLHASIASANIRKAIDDDSARISVWRADPHFFTVQRFDGVPRQIIEDKIGDWTLCTDHFLVEKIYSLRKAKLPNETGGVLIGSYDLQRRIVYVVDTIPSPPDSEEWPTVYIRGCRGLRAKIERVQKATLNRLTYVGEWHSHPSGTGCTPSQHDKTAFLWLSEIMGREGLPALMLIAGHQKNFEFFLGQMV